jgi:hypothetical protein
MVVHEKRHSRVHADVALFTVHLSHVLMFRHFYAVSRYPALIRLDPVVVRVGGPVHKVATTVVSNSYVAQRAVESCNMDIIVA